ncbi:MAG: TM0106 family RecB-like putative nuclease [bacterium]
MLLTASQLYAHIQCPHYTWRDFYGPQEEKIKEVNPFIQMLWNRGIQHEERVVKELGDFLDLRHGSLKERFAKTMQAIENDTPLIYQGVLQSTELLGVPDLLRRLPDGSYLPIEIKSGMAVDSGEGKIKKHYAVQLCLYTELLQQLGIKNDNKGIIFDINRNEVEYRFNEPLGKIERKTCWEFYKEVKEEARALLNNKIQNKPALSGTCKLCPWYNSCKKWCQENQDLTTIFYLGRAKRDVINKELQIEKVDNFSELNVKGIMDQKKQDKSFLKSIGEKTLDKLVARANILCKTKQPVIYKKIAFPEVSYELFFDIEDDPTQEFVYLHGVYERNNGEEKFISFVAADTTKRAEAEAWAKFWEYIGSLPFNDFAVYYYSPHEKSTYRKLQQRYPEVISAEDLDAFFENPCVIDLYQIVLKHTDWPLSSYSLKDLATYLGFRWRDDTPSGALSIEWYNKYLETNDKNILNRILLYNEDDCKATMVLKDAINKLSQCL